jgi:hypothetical protein
MRPALPSLLIAVLLAALLLPAGAAALMPPHVTDTEPPPGGVLAGDTLVVRGYSLHVADLEALRVVEAATDRVLPTEHDLECEREGHGTALGAVQYACELRVTVRGLRPGRAYELRFLGETFPFTAAGRDQGRAGGPSPVEVDGMYGYADASGEVVIEPRFLVAWPFNEHGVAFAADRDGWVLVDGRGREVLRPWVVDNGPDYFSQGLARFVEDGKVGFFNERGEVAIEARFDYAEPFGLGRLEGCPEASAAFCRGCRAVPDGEHTRMVGGRWGCADRSGKVVVPAGSVAPPGP